MRLDRFADAGQRPSDFPPLSRATRRGFLQASAAVGGGLRIVALLGLTTFAIAAWMGTRITQEWSPDDFIPMALVQSVGQGLTFTGLLIFAVSNLNPVRATAFIAYIQVMRLEVIEITAAAMTTWLRVREQVHSNLVGLHVSAGDSEVVQDLARLTGRFAEHSAAAETALARATATLASLVRREANVSPSSTAFMLLSGPRSSGSC
jgi:MFS transporter, DHA2 family, multidrug resistance protein